MPLVLIKKVSRDATFSRRMTLMFRADAFVNFYSSNLFEQPHVNIF